MAEEDKIKYSDIIQPDDSIEKLVTQMGELNKSYEEMVKAISSGAEKIVKSIKSASGATTDGRKVIDEAAIAASRLEKAHMELSIALSDTGKQIAWLKAQTADANKATVEQQRYLQQAVTSYDRLKSDLKEAVSSYKALTDAERANSQTGQKLLSDIISLKEQIKALDAEMKPHIQTLTEVQKAEQKLAYSQSEEGQKLLELKAKIAEVNKATVEQQRYLKQASSSYNRLKSDLERAVERYKSLTEAERADSEMGQQVLADILNLKNQIKALDAEMSTHIQTLTEVQKAEQKLAYLQSEEGQKLLELKAKIAEVTAARRQQKTTTDPLAQAQEKLTYARSEENRQLKLYSTLIQEANRIAKLQVIINNSAEGSYNRLSAQYALNKIKLNQMSQAEREATDSGKKLEEETAAIYQRMIKLQEATGNYTLSVGHYEKAWFGLGLSVSQVVRELPAIAVSLNTFLLGISNNIPMVVDEINKLRVQNKLLQKEGKATVSVTKSMVKALFSWNTVLVVILTVLSMFGSQIVDWIGKLFKAKNAAISTSEALSNIAKELESTNASYGENMVTLKRLQQEWKNLKTTAEKNQWIKDNQSEFNQLGVAIDGVNDAENIFNQNTTNVINALKLRAKAAAAQKLAAEKYEEALVKINEAEAKGVGKVNKKGELKLTPEAQAGLARENQFASNAGLSFNPQYGGSSGAASGGYKTTVKVMQAKALVEEANAAEKTADAYFDLADGYEAAAKAQLDAAGIKGPHKKTKTKTREPREPRDLTDTINKNSIKAQKEYEESVTALQKDEFAKRRKTAADEVQNENNKLREMLRKNDEYVRNVDGKYKKLTEDQKKQIAQQNAWINGTIANNLKALALQLEQIQREQAANSLKLQRETQTGVVSPTPIAENEPKNTETTVTTNVTVIRDASQMEASLVEERELMRQNLEAEYKLILDTNAKLLSAGDEHARSEEEILIEFNKKKLQLYADYDKQILEARERDIENQLELVKKGTEEELQLLLQQNEVRRQLALTENAAKPASEQVSSSVINAKFDKSAAQVKGSFEMTSFDEQQALDEAVFNEVERSEREITRFKLEQEKARWEKQIRLAESGGLNWSQTQIDAAKASIKGIDRELEDLDDFVGNIGKKGLGTTLLENLGFSDDQIDALKDATNIVVEQLKSIMDAEIELAEQAVEAAEKRVEAAQNAYDAEVEARNNGYANNVATAKKELEQEKKNQQEKQKLLAEAQKRREALDTITQASSLITASANLWESFSKIPIVGPALAGAAIATMWTSFAAAKIKAKQVTASQEYGEGGLEFLEGGSHASGDDIDLGAKNSKGRKMRAEGGEALVIINKRRTRKYRKVLPGIVDSLNKGIFEDKYINAFNKTGDVNIALNSEKVIDLSQIERDVRCIKKQNETRYYMLQNGMLVMQSKNVKRIIKN